MLKIIIEANLDIGYAKPEDIGDILKQIEMSEYYFISPTIFIGNKKKVIKKNHDRLAEEVISLGVDITNIICKITSNISVEELFYLPTFEEINRKIRNDITKKFSLVPSHQIL